MRRVALLLLLAGCRGRDFAEDRAGALCERHARCETLEAAGFATRAECQAALDDAIRAANRSGELDCPDYDADAAEACVAVYEETECGEELELGACEGVCG